MKNNNKAENTRYFMRYTSMAFQMIGTIIGFVFMGYFIDMQPWAVKYIGHHVFTLVGTLLGVAGSLYIILKKI